MMNKTERERIGNLMIYLSQKIQPMHLTKLLKLLYLIDETSVKETGVPVTWLDYKVWQYGPVATEVYYDLSWHNAQKLRLNTFISVERGKNQVQVLPCKDFRDDEFSDYEIELFDRVIKQYGNLTGDQLIEKLHQEHTLWDKICRKNKLTFSPEFSTTDYTIDLRELIKDDVVKLHIYDSTKESIDFQNFLDSQLSRK